MSWKSLKQEINAKSKYVLAVSGGIDSIVLMDFFNRQCNTQFVVAYFNHHIRDQNDDISIIQNYCFYNNIEFYVGNGINLKNIKSQENEARNQRWDFLEFICRSLNYDNIVTAHHLNDSVENFILQIMRGNKITSCTMKKNNTINGINRYKPFLEFTKEQLKKSAIRYKLEWNEDETNLDEKYLRNYIRHSIIPMMMKDRNIMKTIPKTIQSVLELEN